MRQPVKLLFLDVDGVLNDRETLVKAANARKQKKLVFREDESLAEMINPLYVEKVNAIVDATDARIVLSSTWRVLFRDGMPAIRRFFKSVGFNTDTWLGRTPIGYPGKPFSESAVRGLEIQSFISDVLPVRKVPAIVILDDNSDMAHLSHRLVLTNGRTSGITDSDVAKAIKLFSIEDDAHMTFNWKLWKRGT